MVMASAQGEPSEPGRVEPLIELRSRRVELAERRNRAQRLYYLMVSTGVLLLIATPVIAYTYASRFSSSNSGFVIAVLVVYGVAPLAMLPTYRVRLRNTEADIQEIDFQIDLQQFDVGKEESRAEKILRINQLQLRRYYDLNLSQNFWVFGLGVLCIFLGISVIVFSLYLVLKVAQGTESKVIVASLGAVGSILANFVAAVYLRMNTSASQNLAEFHSRLVETQQLLLANLLASRIQNDEQRWRALEALATGLGGMKPRAHASSRTATDK